MLFDYLKKDAIMWIDVDVVEFDIDIVSKTCFRIFLKGFSSIGIAKTIQVLKP